ncbi:MAG: zf-HC2 domain-containing protein [Candidatus Rokubacteria bacterium]|nr:zf-HC2 domain-containing protein [Candidatus Rokubacteria bacterium]
MLRCRDIGNLLHDYAEGLLEPGVSRQLEEHLADCPGCLAFVRTYRHTIALSGNLRCEEIPPELQQKLRVFLKEKLGKPRL